MKIYSLKQLHLVLKFVATVTLIVLFNSFTEGKFFYHRGAQRKNIEAHRGNTDRHILKGIDERT
jgi:hypothetical protein